MKRIIRVRMGSAFFSCVSWVYIVDTFFFRIRDQSRVEAIGNSTTDVSCEVIVVEMEKLKHIIVEELLF